MLEALKFVQGAVAKKDFVPEMTHFHINDGFIKSHNGVIALCSPIALNLNVRPKAEPMLRAIRACEGERIVMNMTPAGKLSVKSGAFKTNIECLPQADYFEPEPTEGERVSLEKGAKILPVLRKLLPFVSEDASRPWSRGILFAGSVAYVTNNVIVIEYVLDAATLFPHPVNLSKSSVVEMLRIGEEPRSLVTGESSVTFYYEGGAWLRANTLDTGWPDVSRCFNDAPLFEVDTRLWERVEKLAPFADAVGRMFIQGEEINTGSEGTSVAGLWCEDSASQKPALFNVEHFRKLAGVASHFETNSYPMPCQFSGENLRGAIAGLRDA